MRRAPSIPHRIADFRRGARQWASPGAVWIAGVSGGADSMALITLASRCARGSGWTVRAVHVHHGLRGREADQDAAFVERECALLGVPCTVVHAEVRGRARREGVSIEMAARAARREIFQREVERHGAAGVLVAHTRDDQAETLLLRLARGAGPGGLCGMSPDARVGGLRVVRPLLAWPRSDIEKFLRTYRRPWREDRTNRSPDHLRNRVRHGLLPAMARTLNPAIVETLARNAALWADDEEWIRDVVAQQMAKARAGRDGLNIRVVKKLPVGLRRRVIHQWLIEQSFPARHLDANAVEQVDRVVREESNRETLAAGWSVERGGSSERLTLRPPVSKIQVPRIEIQVSAPGTARDSARRLQVTLKRARGYTRIPEHGIGCWPAVAWMDAKRAAGRTFVLRAWRAGDRYRPFGLRGTAKVQDILTNARIRGADRKGALVLECDDEIVWIPGYRIAHDWAVPSARAPSIRVEIQRR